ncbi:MAG: S8 family serine peptidase [Ignavibacteriae bacterium]|nr:S8 family serine peptidase [Ignavibacteriota bacterium]
MTLTSVFQQPAKCPICSQHVEQLIREFRGEGELRVVQKLQSLTPSWSPAAGLCERCLYLNEFALREEGFLPDPDAMGVPQQAGTTALRSTLFRQRVGNEFALLPTPLRLNADPRFRGKGVTIAFIDSGFSPHPDLIKRWNRIRAIVDVTDDRFPRAYFSHPHVESWHGTMTSVAAAGDGYLSRGLYRGIASDADVVLIKVWDTNTRHISMRDITRALRWAIEHAADYGIRIISLSVADDEPASLRESPVDLAVEDAVSKGIVVVTAVGNNPTKPIVPPASSPSAITVGGLDDQNQIWKDYRQMFHSTFGTTLDGHLKPELIAPAIWVAGPILPGTDQSQEAPLLFKLLHVGQRHAENILENHRDILHHAPKGLAKGDYKSWARSRISEMKYIAPHYKHVDGTSFASPIVSSVVAQMLEANPGLSPADVKAILMHTAEPLRHVARDQQGKGVLNPRAAVELALAGTLRAGVHLRHPRTQHIPHNEQ